MRWLLRLLSRREVLGLLTLGFFMPPKVKLRAIAVSPVAPVMSVGDVLAFTAVGYYANGSTVNLTSRVTWISSAPAILSITNTGMATACAEGSARISASLAGVTGWTDVGGIRFRNVNADPVTSGTSALGEAGTWYTFDDFSTARLNGDGDKLFDAYLTAVPDQVVNEYPGGANRIMSVTSGVAGEQGVYWHMQTRGASGYFYPGGYAQAWSRTTGISWPLINRLQFLVKCDTTIARRADGGDIFQLGTYIRWQGDVSDPTNQGNHYYHLMDPNITANKWMLMVFDMHPQHKVASGGGINWDNDPEFGSILTHYFDSLTRWYFDPQGIASVGTWTVKDLRVGIVDTSTTDDYETSSITATYNGSAYELAWMGLKNLARTYEVRSSTASMKVNGFTSGTDQGTTTNPNSDYGGCFKSITMAESPTGYYLAVRKQGATAFREVYVPYQMGS